MADKREVQLTLGIKTEGTGKAVADLDKIAKEYADIARTSGSVGSSLRLATAEAQRFGASDDQIRSLSKAFNEYRRTIDATTEDVKELAEAQAQAASTSPIADSGGGLSLGQRITRAGSSLRGLPSVQIPGTSIGTDALANIVRLGGALTDFVGETKLATAAVNFLSPALKAQAVAEGTAAAGAVGLQLALGPLIAVGAGVALAVGAVVVALESASNEAEKNAATNKKLAEQYAASDRVFDQVLDGLTSADAAKQIENENKRLKAAQEEKLALAAENERAADRISESVNVGLNKIFNVGTLSNQLAFSRGDEGYGARTQREAELDKTIAETTATIESLTAATKDGSTAANDAKIAEERLAEARSNQALKSADNAGKELAARQKADEASFDSLQKRVSTIENEKEVIEKEIAVLEASGVVSEDVTAKIASLKDQLGLLGKESDYISTSALAAAKARDAEKKALDEQEKALKKAEAAQTQFGKATEQAGRSFTNSIQDIGTRFRNVITDNETKFNRDILDLTTKLKRDEFDIQLKANRAERDAVLDQVDDIRKIQDDGRKAYRDALEEGDFKAAYLAKRDTAESLQEEQQALDTRKQARLQDEQDARADLLRSAQRQRADRMLSYERQATDARLANTREIDQARLTRQRALQVASEGYNAELAQLGSYIKARLGMEKAMYDQSLALANGPNTGGTSGAGQFLGSFSARTVGRIIKR